MAFPIRLNNREHTGAGLYALILFFLFMFFGCLVKHVGVRPEKSIPPESEKTVVSIDYLPDLLTKILTLHHDKPSFNVDVWTGKKRYPVGEEIRFYFRSDRVCSLTLIDYETNGNAKVYP